MKMKLITLATVRVRFKELVTSRVFLSLLLDVIKSRLYRRTCLHSLPLPSGR